MAALAASSPKSSTATLTVDSASFISSLSANEYGDPAIDWAIYDRQRRRQQRRRRFQRRHRHLDENNNNRMWIEVTGTVNARSSRIRVLAEQVIVNLGLLDNIAIWTPGEFNNQSSASTVSYEVLGPGATLATVEYNFLETGSKPLDTSLIQTVTPALPADKVITPELLSYFRALANTKMQTGVAKFFTDVNQIGLLATGPKDIKPWEGVVYVGGASTPTQLTSQQSITWSWNDNPPFDFDGNGVGTHKQPGVIIVDAEGAQDPGEQRPVLRSHLLHG